MPKVLSKVLSTKWINPYCYTSEYTGIAAKINQAINNSLSTNNNSKTCIIHLVNRDKVQPGTPPSKGGGEMAPLHRRGEWDAASIGGSVWGWHAEATCGNEGVRHGSAKWLPGLHGSPWGTHCGGTHTHTITHTSSSEVVVEAYWSRLLYNRQ